MFANKKAAKQKTAVGAYLKCPNDKLSDMDHGIHFSFWNGLHRNIKKRWIFIQEE